MNTEGRRIALAFTELKVSRWEHAVRWYVEILGLKLVLEDAPRRFALLEAGGSQLAIKGSSPHGTTAVSRNVRLVFQVDNVDAERERLMNLGVEVDPPLDDRSEAYRGLTLLDCEGIPITIFSWLVPSEPLTPTTLPTA